MENRLNYWESVTELEICDTRIKKKMAIVNQRGGPSVKVQNSHSWHCYAVVFFLAIAFASIDAYFSLVDDPEGVIIEELNKAKESIDIAMYYFTDRDLANAVIDAHNRAVTERVYLDEDQKQVKHGITIRYGVGI